LKKKILFFSCEPGGAEVLIPAIKLVQAQPQYEAIVAGYGYAMERFSRKKIQHCEIDPVQKEDFSLIDRYAPDLLITSATSLPAVDMSEKHLWQQARQRGVHSLAFLDQWQNYKVRFSGIHDEELLAYQPDWINCLNDIGKSEMMREGFDEARLIAFGHPYLSSLKHDLLALDMGRIRSNLCLAANDEVVLFVSEPIREYYGDRRGYDQYVVLDYFLTNFAGSANQTKILIKLHPKDDITKFLDIGERFKALPLRFVGNELSPLECLAISDSIFGMTSIMLIEAYVLGKKTASLQPGLCVEDPMVLSRHNLIPVMLSSQKCNLLELEHQQLSRFDIDFKAEKLLDFIGEILH